MHLAHGFVIHAPGHLRVPVVNGGKHHHHRGDGHHHVEVGNHKVGIRQRYIHGHVTEEQSGQSADEECRHKANCKQHRRIQMDIAVPQGQGPVIDLDCRGDGDNQGGGGEEETQVKIHATHVHVVRPDDKADSADRQDRPHHHAIAKDILAGVGRENVRHQAEGRKRDDIHLRVAEEPEQVLEQYRATPTRLQGLAHVHDIGHEKAGAEQAIKQQHHRTDEQRRESQQAQYGGSNDRPDRQWHTHQGHAPAAGL